MSVGITIAPIGLSENQERAHITRPTRLLCYGQVILGTTIGSRAAIYRSWTAGDRLPNAELIRLQLQKRTRIWLAAGVTDTGTGAANPTRRCWAGLAGARAGGQDRRAGARRLGHGFH